MPEALRAGLAAYCRGEIFEAHEHWEDGWRVATGADRELLHGLTQLAVARLHASRGNAKGAKTVFARAKARLGGLAGTPRGVDVAALIAEAEKGM